MQLLSFRPSNLLRNVFNYNNYKKIITHDVYRKRILQKTSFFIQFFFFQNYCHRHIFNRVLMKLVWSVLIKNLRSYTTKYMNKGEK